MPQTAVHHPICVHGARAYGKQVTAYPVPLWVHIVQTWREKAKGKVKKKVEESCIFEPQVLSVLKQKRDGIYLTLMQHWCSQKHTNLWSHLLQRIWTAAPSPSHITLANMNSCILLKWNEARNLLTGASHDAVYPAALLRALLIPANTQKINYRPATQAAQVTVSHTSRRTKKNKTKTRASSHPVAISTAHQCFHTYTHIDDTLCMKPLTHTHAPKIHNALSNSLLDTTLLKHARGILFCTMTH